MLFIFSLSANAERITAGGQIPESVHVFPNSGMFVFYATLTAGSSPECFGANRWSIKTTKPGAKELISMVIAAKLAKRTISVIGSGHCNPDGYGYEVMYLYLN